MRTGLSRIRGNRHVALAGRFEPGDGGTSKISDLRRTLLRSIAHTPGQEPQRRLHTRQLETAVPPIWRGQHRRAGRLRQAQESADYRRSAFIHHRIHPLRQRAGRIVSCRAGGRGKGLLRTIQGKRPTRPGDSNDANSGVLPKTARTGGRRDSHGAGAGNPHQLLRRTYQLSMETLPRLRAAV